MVSQAQLHAKNKFLKRKKKRLTVVHQQEHMYVM
jgi:hypothetical protein